MNEESIGLKTLFRTDSRVDLFVKRLDHYKGDLPMYQSELASGFDVRAQLDEPICLLPGHRVLVPTALCFAIPPGYELQVRPRSGLALREGMTLLNTPGTIDADYRGEVKILVINLGHEEMVIRDQDRVAQMVLCPIFQAQLKEVSTLSSTERDLGGFGSTGK